MAKFNDIVKMVSDSIPPFNDYALRGFLEEHINHSERFPALVLEEGFKVASGDIKLVGYDIMSPEETVRHELLPSGNKSGPIKIPLTASHFRLVRYNIKFQDKYAYSYLYMPYMNNDMIKISGKLWIPRKVLLEQTFSRVSEKDRDGMSLSPVRVNLMFNRQQTFRIVSYNRSTYSHFLVTSKLFHGKTPRKACDTTLVHYMIAKFGFRKALAKFGLSDKDIMFVPEIGDDSDQFEYFAAKKYDTKVQEGPGLFLKVRKTVFGDDLGTKFIVNLMYTLSAFDIQNMENIYAEKGSIWMTMIGLILFSTNAGPKAYSSAESHLNSVDTFIDHITRERLQRYGIHIDDIYDLLVYVFNEIDSFMVNNQAQDLYGSRLDVVNGLFVKSYGQRITNQVYTLANRSSISEQDVKKAVRFPEMMFRYASSARPNEDRDYLALPEIIGDNFLFSGGLSKIRVGGRAEQRLHPSMAVGESINAFVGKIIGRTGYINPYVPTDENGTILHPEYAKDIDTIISFLPK